jgi:restriction system protein
MAIPDFQSAMTPLLTLLSDGRDHSNQEIYDALEDRFELTDEERRRLLPSGRQRVFVNRVAWAKSHLKQARLLDSPRRGVYRITARGLDVLNAAKGRISVRDLMQFEEFQEFRGKKIKYETARENECETLTPREQIEIGYKNLVTDLSISLMDVVKSCSSSFFEKIVIDLLLAIGYGGSREDAGFQAGKGADEGIDGIINEDKLGLDVIYLQAKRWGSSVGRPEIQKFAGALLGKKARKGIFITTSTFTKEACDYAASIDTRIILIDGVILTKLMIEHNVGVSTVQAYEIKKVDSDYFLEE